MFISTPPVLDAMSDEQQQIFELIKNKINVITNACAGSGKSTTVLSIASNLPYESLIQITYNTMLSKEIKEKIKNYNLENISVYTYHALAVKYYSRDAYTDTEIIDILQKESIPIEEIPKFTIFVIDEAQDMTKLYYQFIRKFLRDAKNKITMLILGDDRQCLYQFKGADSRFLTHAKELWKNEEFLITPEFKYCKLNISYRITKPMAYLVNEVMLNEMKTIAIKNGCPISYIRRDKDEIPKIIYTEIKKLLATKKYEPKDFFILCPSLKSPMIKKVENLLVYNNISCYYPNNDGDKMDERVIDHKIIFATFHAVKGRQRKIVFVLCFDESYFTFYAKNIPKNKCPNTIYVATTRATERLYVFETEKCNTFPFLKKKHEEFKQIPEQIKFYGLPRIRISQENETAIKSKEHNIIPSEIVRFLSDSFLEKVFPKLKSIFIALHLQELEPPTKIDLPTIIETTDEQFEDISEINGIAIPTLFYDWISCNSESDVSLPINKPPIENAFCKSHLLYSLISKRIESIHENDFIRTFLIAKFNKIEKQHEKRQKQQKYDDNLFANELSHYLHLCNFYNAMENGIYYKLNQIPISKYSWLSIYILQECFDRLYDKFKTIPIEDLQSEIAIPSLANKDFNKKIDEYFGKKQIFGDKKFRFRGRVDFMTPTSIWEIKCTSSLTYENFIQLVIYAFIWNMENINKEGKEEQEFNLFNIRTGECYKIINNSQQTIDIINDIICDLLEYKCLNNPEQMYKNQNDELFNLQK